MPVQYLKLWDSADNELLAPLPYKKVGGKYLYGPEANGIKRKPSAMKPSPWQKVKDGYADLFNILRGIK